MTEQRCQLCDKPTNLVLCDRCIRITQRRLADIPSLVNELETTISRQARAGRSAGHRKKGDDQPLPYNAAASDKRSLVNVLVEWSDHAAQAAHTTPMPLRPPVNTLGVQARAATAILRRSEHWLRTNPDAGDCANAIWVIRDQLRATIDRVPERLWAGPCRAPLPADIRLTDGTVTVQLADTATEPPRCQRQLHRAWGEETITCDGWHDPDELPGCGATYTIDQRHEWLLVALEDELLPLRTVWEALYELVPPLANLQWETVRKWPRKRSTPRLDKNGQPRTDRLGRPLMATVPARLSPRATTASGEPLYSGGDILKLARDELPRRGAKRTRHRPRRAS